MKKITQDEFEKRAKILFGDKYDVSKTKYISTRKKITYICNDCGDSITQYANDFLKGKFGSCRCEKFNIKDNELKDRINSLEFGKNYEIIQNTRKANTVQLRCKLHNYKFNFYLDRKNECPECKRQKAYIEKVEQKYNFGYDYSKTIISKNIEEINVVCKKHGGFQVKRSSLIKGCGCKKCQDELREKKIKKDFYTKFENKYGSKFQVVGEYKGCQDLIEIKCLNCGFKSKITPISLFKKKYHCGCCEYTKLITKDIFLQRAKDIFGDNVYSYDLKNLKNSHSKILVKCLKHNYFFEQVVYSHLQGHGCPVCSETISERKTRVFLEKRNIKYSPYMIFEGLVDKDNLSYDFYIEKYNLLIECNGIQHYKFTPYFHKTLHDFHRQLHHDWLKRKYARDNNIKLLTISYKEFDNIENILKEELD